MEFFDKIVVVKVVVRPWALPGFSVYMNTHKATTNSLVFDLRPPDFMTGWREIEEEEEEEECK